MYVLHQGARAPPALELGGGCTSTLSVGACHGEGPCFFEIVLDEQLLGHVTVEPAKGEVDPGSEIDVALTPGAGCPRVEGVLKCQLRCTTDPLQAASTSTTTINLKLR